MHLFSSKKSFDNRREYRHHTFDVLLSGALIDQEKGVQYDLYPRDVSIRGLGFWSEAAFEEGKHYRLFLGRRSVKVRICHRTTEGKGFRYGLEVEQGAIDLVAIMDLMGLLKD